MGQCPTRCRKATSKHYKQRVRKMAAQMPTGRSWEPDLLHGDLARVEKKIQLLIDAFTRLCRRPPPPPPGLRRGLSPGPSPVPSLGPSRGPVSDRAPRPAPGPAPGRAPRPAPGPSPGLAPGRAPNPSPGPDSQHCVAHFDETCAALRQRMRTVRRWRNGSESWQMSDLETLSTFLLRTRAELIETRMRALVSAISVLEKRAARSQNGATIEDANKMETLKAGTRLICSTVKYMRAHGGALSTLRLTEEKLDYFESVAQQLTEAAAVESRPAPPRVARRATVARTESYTNIEQHPLINALLRNETRIRRITRALDAGHHATQPGGESCAQTCRENDGEVLRRQLEKVERWRRCEATFTRENLDDLQLIVAAVGSHLRVDPDITGTSKAKRVVRRAESYCRDLGGADTAGTLLFIQPLSPYPFRPEPEVIIATTTRDSINERLI